MRVSGTGSVIAVPDRPIRFCTPSSDSIAYPPGGEPAPRYCDAGVDVVGVDLEALAEARTKDGATEGRATLTGTYTAGVLTVEQQEPPTPVPDRPRTQTPPCPEPAGGWPAQGPDQNLPPESNQAFTDYLGAHEGSVMFTALLRPTETTVIAGFAVHDDDERAQVERELRPALGDALCVVDARWTQAELDAAREDPDLQLSPFGSDGLVVATGVGPGDGDYVQPHYRVYTLLVSPELRAAADRHPAGLVIFEPALRPV